jgi:hypothetical protein
MKFNSQFRFQNKQDAIRALKETNGYVLQPNTPPIVGKFSPAAFIKGSY